MRSDGSSLPGMAAARRKGVCLIRYPNGKVYVGQGRTDTITYFGSVNPDLVAADFTDEQQQSFTVTREILWSSTTASDEEVSRVEVEMIRRYRSNGQEFGYNRKPIPGNRTSFTSSCRRLW